MWSDKSAQESQVGPAYERVSPLGCFISFDKRSNQAAKYCLLGWIQFNGCYFKKILDTMLNFLCKSAMDTIFCQIIIS